MGDGSYRGGSMIRIKVGCKVVMTRKQVVEHFAADDCGPNGTVTQVIPGYWKGSTAASKRRRVANNTTGYRIAFDDLVKRHGRQAFNGNVYAIDEFKRR